MVQFTAIVGENFRSLYLINPCLLIQLALVDFHALM